MGPGFIMAYVPSDQTEGKVEPGPPSALHATGPAVPSPNRPDRAPEPDAWQDKLSAPPFPLSRVPPARDDPCQDDTPQGKPREGQPHW